MIDFHNHILPNIDDGSKSMTMSIEMLKNALSQGITDVVNTVHFQHPKVENMDISFQRIKKEIEILQSELNRLSIPIKLYFGAEVFFLPNLMEIKDNPLTTFGHGKYMLIEFQPNSLPQIQRQVLFALKMSGVTPIIAHPERYKPVQDSLNIVEDWLNSGCLIQVDAGSILGKFGEKSRKCSEIIIKKHWCHIIGSDAHNNGRRNFCLGEVIKKLKNNLAQEYINDMINENPKAVIKGNPIIIDFEYEPLEKNSKFFQFLTNVKGK